MMRNISFNSSDFLQLQGLPDTTSNTLYSFAQMQQMCEQARLVILKNDIAYAVIVILISRVVQMLIINDIWKLSEKSAQSLLNSCFYFEIVAYIAIIVRMVVSV